MVYSKTKNNKLKDDVERAIKRISVYITDTSRTLPKEEAKLQEYRDTLLAAFNERYKYIRKYDKAFKQETKVAFQKAYDKYVERTINCLSILGYTIEKPKNSFDNFEINTVIQIGPPYGHSEGETAGSDKDLSTLLLDPGSSGSRESLASEASHSEQNITSNTFNLPSTGKVNGANFIMPITNLECLKLAGGQISKPYSGDALALQPFVNSVKLIKTIAGAEHADLIKTFVLSKLEGKALECVPSNVADVDEIITALQESIKPDNSDVVAGRLKALKCQQNNLAEYAKQAELLADALQRALVVEGFSLKKAKELTVKETIKLCCSNAKSENDKLILEAKDREFDQPKDVIARFIVQSAKAREEKQVLTYRSFSQNQYQNRRGRGNHYSQNRQNHSYENRNNNSTQNYGNNSFSNNNRGNSNSRGFRGRGRGNLTRGNNSYYRRNSNFGQQNHFLRILTETLANPGSAQAQASASTSSSSGNQQPNYRLPF